MIILAFTAIIGLFILICVYWYVIHTKLMQSESNIPFLPWHLPLIGHMHRLRHWNDFYGKQMAGNYLRYGDTVGVYFMQKRFVFTRDLKVLEELMSSPNFIDKPWTYRIIEGMIGKSVLTVSGELWKKRRRLLTPAFHFDILKGFLEVMEDRSLELVQIMDEIEKDEKPFDALKLCGPLALSVLCGTSMGLEYTIKDILQGSKFESLFKGVNSHFINKVLYPWYRNDFIYGLSSVGKNCARDIKALKDFVYEIIEKRLEFRKTHTITSRRRIFIDTMLDAYEKGEIDVDGIITEVNIFVLAGYDTTANTLSWALYLLGRNKSKQDVLYKEIVRSGLESPLKMEELSQLKYLDCVIKETHRLMPVVMRIGRSIPAGTNLGGTVFPDCNISIDIMHMNRNPEVWQDPMSYMPERFNLKDAAVSTSQQEQQDVNDPLPTSDGPLTSHVEVENADKDESKDSFTRRSEKLTENSKRSNAYRYIPFSAGPRNCIGQRFAMNELRMSLFHIITNYEVTAIHSQEELIEDFSFVHKAYNGLMLTIKRR